MNSDRACACVCAACACMGTRSSSECEIIRCAWSPFWLRSTPLSPALSLVVEPWTDLPSVASALCGFFATAGATVRCAEIAVNGTANNTACAACRPDLVLVDAAPASGCITNVVAPIVVYTKTDLVSCAASNIDHVDHGSTQRDHLAIISHGDNETAVARATAYAMGLIHGPQRHRQRAVALVVCASDKTLTAISVERVGLGRHFIQRTTSPMFLGAVPISSTDRTARHNDPSDTRGDGGPNDNLNIGLYDKSVHTTTTNDEPVADGVACIRAHSHNYPESMGFVRTAGDSALALQACGYLGSGTAARVFGVRGRDDLVVKIMSDPAVAQHEARVLTRLTAVADVPKLVRVDAETLLLWPRAVDWAKEPFDIKHALQALDVMTAAHAVGIVHRDFRPANLLRTIDGSRVLVNDWGFAAEADAVEPYRGTLAYASDAVLAHMIAGHTQFRVSRADDLESLVRTLYIMSGRSVAMGMPAGRDLAARAARLMRMWKKAMTRPWRRLQDLARAGDARGLRDALPRVLTDAP
ncbi:Protein kinase catalytic domain containing protein [Pandoravirus celtis]|uniref:Protein kinase catalytic domain containing protein n=1 Tax=Pandoravirus celtis TaxID=2568002 RepID=A0A4D6EJP8_9VIRU|nr:Protein kinase catalytic domain containing protein [Pandoravirus celtis]